MFILVDKDNLMMVAAARSLNHIGLIAAVDFPNVATATFNGLDGRSWSMLSEKEVATLYTNMSGEKAPGYGECVAQLRDYVGTWDVYHRSEAELQREYHTLEVEDENKYSQKVNELKARQAAIDLAASFRLEPSAE